MILHFNVNGERRKAMVKAIEEGLGTKATYLGVPSCAYSVGDYTVGRNSELEFFDEIGIGFIMLKINSILHISGDTCRCHTSQQFPGFYKMLECLFFTISGRYNNRSHKYRAYFFLVTIQPACVQKLLHISADPQPLNGSVLHTGGSGCMGGLLCKSNRCCRRNQGGCLPRLLRLWSLHRRSRTERWLPPCRMSDPADVLR